MPMELIADFRPRVGATKVDDLWTAMSIAVALRLDAEPGARFRIRGLPQGIDNTKTGPGGAITFSQPINLGSEDIPEKLRPRLEVPRAGEWWVRSYTCEDCLDPATGKPGRWVPDRRLRLHKEQYPGHRIKRGRITHKGLKSTWQPERQVFMGSPERLALQTPFMPSAAVTWAPEDPKMLARFSWIAILPVRKIDDYERVLALVREAVPGAESVVVLPKRPADLDALVAWLKESVDEELCVAEEMSPQEADRRELEEQIARDRAASAAVEAAQTNVDAAKERLAALSRPVAALPAPEEAKP